MNESQYLEDPGPLEARYLAFLETISTLRPSLHRYCARMTGSVMDGEDVVQGALFEAYRKLEQFDQNRPLKPRLFRIAHNRCIDFLRRRGVRDEAELAAAVPEAIEAAEPVLGTRKAVEHLVLTMPPKERACVLLKDVFDYSLQEIAELVDSTVGGVKAALNRARRKLTESSRPAKSVRTASPELKAVMQLYIERFNRRDWDGVRELVRADARLIAERFAGKFAKAPYFFNYDRWLWRWKLALGEVDGEPVVIVLRRGHDAWTPHPSIRFEVAGALSALWTTYTVPGCLRQQTPSSLLKRRWQPGVVNGRSGLKRVPPNCESSISLRATHPPRSSLQTSCPLRCAPYFTKAITIVRSAIRIVGFLNV